jgi:PPOX class probable F420-dependent enzyme
MATNDAETTTLRAVPAISGPFDHLRDQWTVMLTTFRRDGTPVETPVNIAVAGAVAYVRTFDPSGKLKRVRNDARVEVAPCTVRGRVTGPAIPARARILEGPESAHAATELVKKYPFHQGKLVPWMHRRKGVVTTHLELRAR